MALRIWLPLTGDLENIGISGIEPQLMGTGITYTAGKLGNAATFPNNCNSCIHMPGLRLQVGTWTAWIKVNGAGATTRQCIISEGRDSYTDGVEFYTNQAGTTLAFKAHGKTLSTTITLNTWYHVAGVFGNGNVTFYVNGSQVGTTTYTGGMTYTYASDFTLGKMSYAYTNTSAYFSFNGQLNDVRVYDEVLSIKEIKEIAQGLVLHYKLNEIIGNNLLQDTPKSVTNSSYRGYQLQMTENLIEGQTYTLQLWDVDVSHSEKTVAQTGVWIYWGGGSVHLFNWAGSTYFTNGHANYLEKTFTITNAQATGTGATNAWFDVYNSVGYVEGTMNLTIGKWKLTKGSTKTEWSPCVTPYIKDSSGYNHDGTIIGTLTLQQDTTRYNTSTAFAASSAINCGRGAMVTDSITVNVWAKYSSYSNLLSCTEGGGWNFENNSGLTFPIYIANIGYVHIDAANRPAVANYANAWHMFTGVYDRLNQLTKLYIDGVLIGTGAVSAPNLIQYHTSNVIWINAEATGSNTTGTYGNAKSFADVRIYATALSDNDILDLYHTPANIDNLQNIHEFELNEILNQQPALNWRDPSLITMSGWSGSATYNNAQDYLVLTATNGWRTFAWKTNEAQGKTCLLEFDYYVADATNLSSTGIFVVNLDAVAYGTPLLTLNSTTGQWHHCSYTISTAQKFVGINIRGTDNTGNSVIIWLRNLKIQEINASSNLSQIYQNGVTATGQFHEEGSEWLHSTTGGTFTPTDKSNNTIHYSVVDLRSYAALNQDITVRIEADASWTAFTAGSAGTFNGVWFQGANFPVGATTSSWSGTNYICNALNNQYNLHNATTITTAGAYHYDTTATIPASWFTSYERSNVGMRCDYSDGTGTFTLRNLKVTPLVNYYNAKIGKDFISANQFIEK